MKKELSWSHCSLYFYLYSRNKLQNSVHVEAHVLWLAVPHWESNGELRRTRIARTLRRICQSIQSFAGIEASENADSAVVGIRGSLAPWLLESPTWHWKLGSVEAGCSRGLGSRGPKRAKPRNAVTRALPAAFNQILLRYPPRSHPTVAPCRSNHRTTAHPPERHRTPHPRSGPTQMILSALTRPASTVASGRLNAYSTLRLRAN